MNFDFLLWLPMGFGIGVLFTIFFGFIGHESSVSECEMENAPYQCHTVTIPMTEAGND